MEVDVVLFDVGGTVFDWRTAISNALSQIGSQRLENIDPDVFGAHWRKQSLIEVEAIAGETSPWCPFDPVLQSSLDRTFHNFGIDGISDHDKYMLLKSWEEMPVWPEVPGGIERLRQKYFVAPHTILSLRVAAFSSKRAGVSWDAIVSCDALGSTKLNPQSYARALSAIGRPAEKVCFVAAHPSDLRAAREHGMKTAYVVARLHDYGDDYKDTGFTNEFDLVAENFAHLAELMGA